MQDKGKMSLWDFVSTWDSEDENPDKNWSKHWEKVVPEILKDEKLTSKHAGDCTKESSPCMLCMIENMLAEYREYYFTKGHRLLGRDVEARQWIDIQIEQPEVGRFVLFVVCNPEHYKHNTILVGCYDPDFGGFLVLGEVFSASHWLPLDILPPLPNKEKEG